MEKPVFSIITATYNHENYILDCIRSVQAQTFPNWEMIIVNDGSTDNTASVITSAASADPRIKFYDQPNVGIFRLRETYNLALRHCIGEFVCILEGDDVWERDKLERQMKVFREDENVIFHWGKAFRKHSDLSAIYDVQPDIEDPQVINKFYNDPPGTFLNVLYFRNVIPALTAVIRKDRLDELGGFIQSHNLPLVDYPTILALVEKGKFYYDPTPLGSWRINPNQITKTYPIEITEGIHAAAIEHFRNLSPEIKSQVNVTEKEIKENYQNIVHIALARSGRYKLIRREFKSARKDYARAIFYRGTKNYMWRVRSAVGLAFSFFHLNVEGLAQLLGKDTFFKK